MKPVLSLATGFAALFSATVSAAPTTWCNPLPLPDYPVGKLVRDITNGAPTDGSGLWQLDHKEQYRELADPTAVWWDNKWYLYPSVDMAWVSEDNGATWQHHPLNVRDIGYAPTVVRHHGHFLLLGSGSDLYTSDDPLGPFTSLGPIQLPSDSLAPGQTDPMLFSDDDGRLYYYWGCTATQGIWMAELNATNPVQVISQPTQAIPFRPSQFPWEAVGNWNQNPNSGWIEGSWMLKYHGKYYLTFSAAGTENRTYAMGCYLGASPLGPFTPQQRNPIFRSPEGLITGTGHGCIVAGPGDQLYAFYSVRAAVVHAFERRVGLDRAEIDANGELYVPAATSIPQFVPGSATNSPGWLPLNEGTLTTGSSTAPNLPGRFAVDNDLRTWWQPADNDPQPVLTSLLTAPGTINAVRILWRDVGLNTKLGVYPGPFQYRVEVETSPNQWTTIIDRSRSQEDLLIDYRECPPTTGDRVRLVITGWPPGIHPAVAEFTAFGKTVVERH